MQSPFEVLEWNSASKEQDVLIDQLFGDTCTSNRFQPNGDHEGSEFLHINVSKKGKRKALVNDEDTEKAKKKKKEKRERNKFKRDLKLTSQLERNGLEGEESKLTDKSVKKSEGKPKGKRVKNKFKRDEQFNSQLLKCKSQQYGSVIDESIDESKSFKSGKEVEENTGFNNKDKTKQVASIDSALLSSADAKAEILKSSSCEPVEHKRKKDKKKKKIDKRKSDHASTNDDCDASNMEQTEANHMHIGRPQTNGDEKDYSKTKLDSIWITKNRINTDQDEASPSFPNSQSSLHEKMSKQLESSRFRWINEQLYTTTGDEAAAMFSKDPGLFDVYHRGFTNQVKLWPVNPVDKIIQWLRKRPSSQVVADFGCGEALIAQSITNKVYSFDLIAKNKFVTACNMSKVPLNPSCVDVAVFCLSLMGTNLPDFLREAHRVLKPGGVLKIAEVTSRIKDKAEFTKSLSRLGFKLESEDTSNKMFVLFDFIKDKEVVKATPLHKLGGLKLNPCIYKKR